MNEELNEKLVWASIILTNIILEIVNRNLEKLRRDFEVFSSIEEYYYF